MAPERRAPTDPVEWLARAKSNLTRARMDGRLEGVYLEDLCFDAQQAAEKAIKAVCLYRHLTFPYVHDLRKLLDLLLEKGEDVPGAIKEAACLTEYAVAARYPGLDEPVTQAEYENALLHASIVIQWAEGIIKE